MKNKAILLIVPFLAASLLVGCGKEKFDFKATRIAVFADNQLTKATVTGIVENNAVYLRQHLLLAKEQNVDVIMISGDLVNNAISGYYDRFEDILKDVYGKDETAYPEFVYTMGNHEWYDLNENNEAMAIKYFKKHARIKTDALRKQSEYTIPGFNETAANYYKVVNGIPFISISGDSPSGMISYKERDEIKSWLKEIAELPSVKSGGPIFASYHYPIMNVTYTHGQGASDTSIALDDLLKNYPQVVLFTGDTHFSGVNERTINQVNYTAINIGSSTYTRTISRSATMANDEIFYNVQGNKSKDTIDGEVGQHINETPHIHIIDIDENGETKINRYFSTDDATNPTHIGLEWTIPNNISKEMFKYTNERFSSVEWAKTMYDKNGLTWKETDEVSYGRTADKLYVTFKDVIDYHWCEHYRITVTTDSESKTYAFVNNYFKYLTEPSIYNFEILGEDLPEGTISKIQVEARDFFDNPSLNKLEA